jgi:hypothetical protein
VEIDSTKYSKHTWKNLGGVIMFLNPAMVILELLGQVFPKTVLVNKETNDAFIPCEHCGELHSTLTWSLPNKTQTRNWFGLYCNNCNNIISVNRNLLTWILIGLTYPFWFWKLNDLRQNWLNKQPERFKNLNLDENYYLTKIHRLRGIIATTIAIGWIIFLTIMFILNPELLNSGFLLPMLVIPLLFAIYMAYANFKNQKKHQRMLTNAKSADVG